MATEAERKERLARVERLREQIREHPGSVARRNWRGLALVNTMLNTNYDHLMTHLREVNDQQVALQLASNVGEDAREFQRAFHAETYRLLHNFTASAGTLVDHGIRVLDKEDRQFRTQWKQRVADVIAAPVTDFIKNLRNVLLHEGLPLLSGAVRFDGAEWSADISMPRDDLLRLSGWSVAARDYMEIKGERIELADVVTEYMQTIEGLYDWLFPRFEELHGEEIDGVNALMDQYNRALRGDD